MTMRVTIALAVILGSSQSVLAQSQTQNGATLGGVAGAVIGGIIGKQNDETPEGVLIGGAVGALTGGLIGRAQDNELQRQRAYQEQAYARQQQQPHNQCQTETDQTRFIALMGRELIGQDSDEDQVVDPQYNL